MWPRLIIVALLPLLLGATRITVTFHVAVSSDGKPVASDAWIDGQLRVANRLFRPANIELVRASSARAVADPRGDIMTVAQRHRLARQAPRDGAIHVFVVNRLADKDKAGSFIYGVMWYYAGKSRKLSGRRYVILSNASPPPVLAHELGHFFLLRHTRSPRSVMTTSGRRDPNAGFSNRQVRKIRRSLRMFRRWRLVRPIANP